jgi:hypothetical protein
MRLLKPLRSIRGVAASGLFTLLAACSTGDAAPPAPAAPASVASVAPVSSVAAGPDALWQQVQAEVGKARCEQDAQCRSIGAGHKACGGPAFYLAWSVLDSRPDALQQKVDAHARAQADAQARAGMVSNCMAEADPGARCDAAAGRCVLNARRSGVPLTGSTAR